MSLLGVQIGLVYVYVGESPAFAVGLAVLVQLLKVPVAGLRLRDLGIRGEEGLLAIFPLANIGLFFQLLTRSPSDAERSFRWAAALKYPGFLDMARSGVGVVMRVLPVMGVVAVLVGLIQAALEDLVVWGSEALNVAQGAVARPGLAVEAAGSVTWVSDVMGVLCIVLAGYTLIQFFKRKRASRVSWIPSLLLAPIAMFLLAVFMVSGGKVPTFVLSAVARVSLGLAWWCLFGGVFAAIWIALSETRIRTGQVQFSRAKQLLQNRVLDVIGPHGGSVLLIWVGMQVVIPGVHYALMYVFVDHAVVLHPERRSFRTSAWASRPLRRRIFLLLFAGFLCWMGMEMLAMGCGEAILHLVWPIAESPFLTDNGSFSYFLAGEAWLNMANPVAPAVWSGRWISRALGFSTFVLVWGAVASGLTWLYLARMDELDAERPDTQDATSAESA